MSLDCDKCHNGCCFSILVTTVTIFNIPANFFSLIASILEKASFGVATISSGLSQAERDKAVSDFTDSSSSLDVCVLSINISSAGLNLHPNCCTGIIIPLMWNANTQLQICGRLIRLGQNKPVTWRILEVRGTLFDWVKDRIFRKFNTPFSTISAVANI